MYWFLYTTELGNFEDAIGLPGKIYFEMRVIKHVGNHRNDIKIALALLAASGISKELTLFCVAAAPFPIAG